MSITNHLSVVLLFFPLSRSLSHSTYRPGYLSRLVRPRSRRPCTVPVSCRASTRTPYSPFPCPIFLFSLVSEIIQTNQKADGGPQRGKCPQLLMHPLLLLSPSPFLSLFCGLCFFFVCLLHLVGEVYTLDNFFLCSYGSVCLLTLLVVLVLDSRSSISHLRYCCN